MKPDNESGDDCGSRFRTTQWSIIMLAAQTNAREGTAALAKLYVLYWFPLYAYLRRKGYPPHDAQDLTQGFFVDLIERRALAEADKLKGKFRTFLLTCFQNYLSVEAQRARRVKRGGGMEIISLDLKDAEGRYLAEPIEYLTPDKLFDAHWAVTLLTEVLSLLRQAYANEGKELTFDAIKAFLDPINNQSMPSYDEVARRIGVSTGAVKTLIHRLRKRFTALLREQVGRTVSDSAEIDEEIHGLCDALIAAGGRLGS